MEYIEEIKKQVELVIAKVNDKTKRCSLSERYVRNSFPQLYEDLCSWSFPSDFGFTRKLYHYIHNDRELKMGLCKSCGKRCGFHRITDGYNVYCSNKCSHSDNEVKERIRNTKLEKYGDANYNNRESAKKTCNERYGGNGAACSKETQEKAKRTKLERYGDANYNNVEKFKETLRNKSSEEREETKRKQSHTKQSKSDYEKRLIGSKISNTKHSKRLERSDDVVGYAENGDWICKCGNADCTMCEEKQFPIYCKNYYARKKLGIELCTKLNPIGATSSWCEAELLDYVKSVYDGEVIEGDRKVLNGKELNIYIPERSLAIELNGIYWHSELYKDKDYHYGKTVACMDKGIQLLHIWEDDWKEKTDIVKNLINGKLGLQERKVNARECVVREVETKTAKAFCERYHIQGYANSNVKLGLYKDDELLMVALFGQGRTISGAGKKDGEWELYRLCSPFGCLVRGGAGKLLKHFINKIKPNSIVTFADMCVSNGNLYERIGFEKLYIVKPTYYWCCENKKYPRYRFQKSNLDECKENSNLTEDDVMHERGYYKLYDAGKIKYMMNI